MADTSTDASLGGLKTDLPLALLPVRLETRVSADGQQLLVRIYPDVVHVDAFEPKLTDVEVIWGEHFWRQTRLAGDNEARQRSAWAQLAERFGPPRAAWIAEALTPSNIKSWPAAEPQFAYTPDHTPAWTRAPYTRVLPDRWVARGYAGGKRDFTFWGKPIRDPLAVGPSPDTGLDAETLADDPNAGWLIDFDNAEEVGMGLRIPYELKAGAKLDRLIVLGVKSRPSGGDDQQLLEALFHAHHYTQGLAFVPQGTPTNNTPDAPSGYSTQDPGYQTSYNVERMPAPPSPVAGPVAGSNRDVTARALGIDDGVFAHVREATGTEQLDAEHMNTVLWQATWGYFLEQLMAAPGSPSDAAIRQGREHFVRYVRAGGPLPALRIGNQPYGLLPVISLDRWQPLEGTLIDAPLMDFLGRLLAIWRRSLAAVPRFPGSTDAAETLLQILAMEPISVDYVARPGQSMAPLPTPPGAEAQKSGSGEGKRLAAELGLPWWTQQQVPRLGRMVFASYSQARLFQGALVQPSRPEVLSETQPPDYLTWLADASYADLRQTPLNAQTDVLLYRLVRHAILQEYVAAAYRVLLRRGLARPEERWEYELVGMQTPIPGEPTPTPWRLLERQVAGLTPAAIGSYLDDLKTTLRDNGYQVTSDVPADVAAELDEFRAFTRSLDYLAIRPAAVLHRLLRETLDLCSHRFDAWATSFATKRLEWLRRQHPEGTEGIYLGAYGWVEDLARGAQRQKVDPSPDGDEAPVYESEGNKGFVHAPSLAHATTAAILRSGYLSRLATDDRDGNAVAVNLSSERVRLALWLLDGVRQGQPLGALLGYRFERGLHENHPDVIGGLDQYIAAFRRIAPLVDAQPTNNVVDGLALLRKWKTAATIPWGTADLPSLGTDDYIACDKELASLEDAVDAIGDLVIAESVHQVAQGNPVRAGATLDAIAQGEAPPPELEVIRTPRTGIGITHRIAVLFSGLPGGGPAWGPQTVRAQAEPFLNAWAAQLLGLSAAGAQCRVEYLDPATGQVLPVVLDPPLTVAALGLAPQDLLYLPEGEGEAQRSELEQRVLYYALQNRPDGVAENAGVRLTFARGPTWQPDTLTFAELLEAARTARRLVAGARALGARDLALPEQSIPPEADADVAPAGEPADSPEKALRLGDRADVAVDAFREACNTIQDALPAEDTDTIDSAAVRLALMGLAAFGIPGAVPLSAVENTPEALSALRTQAQSVGREAGDRLRRIEALEGAYAQAMEADTPPTPAATRDYHLARLGEVFGPDFRVLPRFTPPYAGDLGPALAASDALQGGDALQAITWFQRVARVREGAARLDSAMLYAEALGGTALNFTVGQLPYQANKSWVALPRTATSPPGSRLSLVLHAPAGIDLTKPFAGLLVDEWLEVVPSTEETTGVAFHFDAPASRAPQAILLAVAPDGQSEWDLDTLEATVLETLELAKLRAVDLSALAELGQFLPALYFAHNPAGDTVAIDFAPVPVSRPEEV